MSSRHARTAHSKSALEWLRGKRVVFVGDSTARFEYLTLVLWAETGVLPVCDLTALACLHDSSAKAAANVASSPPPPMPTGCEYGPHRWDKFYKWSHSILNGHEVCDCGFVHGRRERRLYEHEALGFSAAFYFWMGGDVYGQGAPTDFAHIACPAGASIASREQRNRTNWLLPPDELVRATASLKPTHLIVGPGWWKVHAASTRFWDSLAAAGNAAVAPQGGNVYFRTTLRPRNAFASCRGMDTCSPVDYDPSALLRHGWRLYDVSAYLASRYNASDPRFDALTFADGIHLNPGANAELVSGLLAHTLSPAVWPLPGPEDEAPVARGIGYSITGSAGPHCPRMVRPPMRNAACMKR
jgi:hypothetical protein